MLVRIRAASLCHTDLEAIEGSLAVRLPAVLGHEAAGEIAELGDGVTDLAIGDRVVLSWNPHCGRCFYCERAQPILCRTFLANGPKAFHFDGKTAAGVRWRADAPVDVPRRLLRILRRAGAERDPRAGDHAVRPRRPARLRRHDRRRRRNPHRRPALGRGGDGDRLRRRRPVRRPGLPPRRRRRDHRGRSQPGAPPARSGRSAPPTPAVRSEAAALARSPDRNGRGADVVIEAAGRPESFRLSMEAVRPGGQVVWLGKTGVNEEVAFRWGSLMQEKRITRSSYGGAQPAQDFPLLARAYLDGTLKLDEMISARIPLEAINEGFAALKRGETVRSVIMFRMKVYEGGRSLDGAVVTVDGAPLDPALRSPPVQPDGLRMDL